ncbi:MAG: baseplate J/gp47 family protein [Eubacteriales bacterium]|nr:baseplate J/gp47 family protein [Eubacteriales bacterium]
MSSAAENGIRALNEYPDISFIDNMTLERLESQMISWFREKRKELTGKDVVLADGDDRKIILQACALVIFQAMLNADNAGKMGLLKYSTGKYLENIGALKHISPRKATGSTTTLRFSLREPRTVATGIPKGTRVTAGDGVYFATNEYCEISEGETSEDIRATCLTPGKAGDNYGMGELNRLVDSVPMIDAVKNITIPENGLDDETEEDYREQIYAAPDGYSSAGSRAAYEYYARKYNPAIEDVSVKSPSPRIVEIRCLLEGGAIPGEEFLSGLNEYLSQSDIKMLTDKIETIPPDTEPYEISITYYINQSDRGRAESIRKSVDASVDDYVYWQKMRIGRDINPDELLKRVMAAGAKRAVIRKPVFAKVNEDSVASLIGERAVLYGGLEDD